MEFPTKCYGCVTAEAVFSQYNLYAGEEATALADKTDAEMKYKQTNDPEAKARFSSEAEVASEALRLAKNERARCAQSLQDKARRCQGYDQDRRPRCGMPY